MEYNYRSFTSDYTEGAHPAILEALTKTNLEQNPGYGTDKYCESAKARICEACGLSDADVFFTVGGTQTNKTVISALLKPYESVIAAASGHIAVHEAGAIENSGHKVETLPAKDGKLTAADVRSFLSSFHSDPNNEHMTCPGMVYISFPTEYGTIYSKKELTALYDVCREYRIPLFIDGARLGYGLESAVCDLSLPELARLCDVFYIGGTKVGALFGEAIVFSGMRAPEHFVTTIKQQGGLLAKGWLIGLQFDTLFFCGRYFNISRNAVIMAEKMKKIFIKHGYPLAIDSPTNQQFVVMDNDKIESLSEHVGFEFWEKYDDTHSVVRFVTSWATTNEAIEFLDRCL